MALVGACFSIAFTCGRMLGAVLSTIDMVPWNKFAVAADVSLLLVVAETLPRCTSMLPCRRPIHNYELCRVHLMILLQRTQDNRSSMEQFL